MARRKGNSVVRVVVHAVETRALVTVGETSDAWAREGKLAPPSVAVPNGALVRLRPPHGTPTMWVDAVRESVKGASGVVVVMPPATPPVVVPQGEPVQSRVKLRDVVEVMVAEAVCSDREALRVLVGEILDKEGL